MLDFVLCSMHWSHSSFMMLLSKDGIIKSLSLCRRFSLFRQFLNHTFTQQLFVLRIACSATPFVLAALHDWWAFFRRLAHKQFLTGPLCPWWFDNLCHSSSFYLQWLVIWLDMLMFEHGNWGAAHSLSHSELIWLICSTNLCSSLYWFHRLSRIVSLQLGKSRYSINCTWH